MLTAQFYLQRFVCDSWASFVASITVTVADVMNLSKQESELYWCDKRTYEEEWSATMTDPVVMKLFQ